MGLIIKEILKTGENRLAQAGCPDPKLDAELLFCHIMNMTKMQLFVNWSEELGDLQCEHFFNILEVRASGVPLQYITGSQEFMGMEFEVNPDVLIPRQDTENLVETAAILIRRSGVKKSKILDLCTGSGAIAISLKKILAEGRVFSGEESQKQAAIGTMGTDLRQISAAEEAKNAPAGKKAAPTKAAGKPLDVEMTASDVSSAALTVAKKNAAALGAKVEFVSGDLFAPFKKKLGGARKFDFIITNPPYIPSGVIPTLQREVKDHEPVMALDGGADGLDFYRRIVREAPKHLNEGGMLLMEIGHDQAGSIKALAESEKEMARAVAACEKRKKHRIYPYFDVEIRQDYAGHDRIAILSLACETAE